MISNTTLLLALRRMTRLYGELLKEAGIPYGLSQAEIDLLGFLQNNPGRDTASDFVELRMMQKGNVSQTVEALIQKGLLLRSPDAADRRRVHLLATPQAQPILADLRRLRADFQARIFQGFSEEEQALYFRLNDRIIQNTQLETEKASTHES